MMLQSCSKSPTQVLGLPSKRDLNLKQSLPTKRKRDIICGLGTFTAPFFINPSSDTPYDKPISFKPVRVIARAQLPLTFLDSGSRSRLSSTRLFHAHLEILERDNVPDQPTILIVRHETTRALYAVERVETGTYSLSKLAGWVKEKEVAELWDPSTTHFYETPRTQARPEEQDLWWRDAVIGGAPEQAEEHDDYGSRVKRVKLSMLRADPEPLEVATQNDVHPTLSGESGPDVKPVDAPDVPLQLLTGQQMCENLVHQYLEAVYLSKTSLAYFVKGPISRIRAVFTSPDGGAPPTSDLVMFLRSMLLSYKAQERKYREKLPDIIKFIPPGTLSDDEMEEMGTRPRKTKKKLKLNKDGVYPIEEGIIKRWWVSEMPSPERFGEETVEQRIRRRVGDLKIRETLAQLILMLEIASLEALLPREGYQDQPNDKILKNEPQEGNGGGTRKKKKKLEDIKVQIDLLLDRLCIWQTVEQDDMLSLDADSTGNPASANRLQSFCLEVIVPFYIGRVPKQAMLVNKSLGGPVNSSPPKRKAMRPPPIKKTGEAKEPDKKKPRRTLERAATDTIVQLMPTRTPQALARASRDPTPLSRIKREGSEVPLQSIPLQRSPSAAAKQSMAAIKHLTRREIDLGKSASDVAAKLRKKIKMEADLKEAISALKKPNRDLAAGGYVDDIEKRGLGLGMAKKPRKPANPTRKVVKDVQVSETPRFRRTVSVMETPGNRGNPFVRDSVVKSHPTSDFCVPSSNPRPASTFVPETTHRKSANQRFVEETPSKMAHTIGNQDSILATPSRARSQHHDSGRTTASKSTGRILSTPSKKPARASIFETPLKQSAIRRSPSPENGDVAAMTSVTTEQSGASILSTPVKQPAPSLPPQITCSSAVGASESTKQRSGILSTPMKQPTITKLSQLTEGSFTESANDLAANSEANDLSMPLKQLNARPSPAHEKGDSLQKEEASIYDALGWNDDVDDMY